MVVDFYRLEMTLRNAYVLSEEQEELGEIKKKQGIERAILDVEHQLDQIQLKLERELRIYAKDII